MSNVQVETTRDSVCMADDMQDHTKTLNVKLQNETTTTIYNIAKEYGIEVNYGTKGAVRVDVIETLPDGTINVYDLKTGSAKLTPKRIAQIQKAVNPDVAVNVIEIK